MISLVSCCSTVLLHVCASPITDCSVLHLTHVAYKVVTHLAVLCDIGVRNTILPSDLDAKLFI